VLICFPFEEFATGSGGIREEHFATFCSQEGSFRFDGGQLGELEVVRERVEGG
jgi:hypothetical protein